MAIIDPTFIDPASPPRVRGQFLVQKWRDKYIMRRWPRRGGPRDARLRNWQRDQFGLAAQMCANPWPVDLWTAIEIVKGTQMIPRDFLMMCCYGRGYIIEDVDGSIWPVADHGPWPIIEPEESMAGPVGMLQLNPHSTHVNTPGFLKLCPVILPPGFALSSIQFAASSAAPTAKITPCVYDDVSGSPTNLLSQGPSVTGILAGVNDFPLSTILTPTTSQIVWLGAQHETANITVPVVNWNIAFALLSHTGALPNPISGMSYLSGNDSLFWGLNG